MSGSRSQSDFFLRKKSFNFKIKILFFQGDPCTCSGIDNTEGFGGDCQNLHWCYVIGGKECNGALPSVEIFSNGQMYYYKYWSLSHDACTLAEAPMESDLFFVDFFSLHEA